MHVAKTRLLRYQEAEGRLNGLDRIVLGPDVFLSSIHM